MTEPDLEDRRRAFQFAISLGSQVAVALLQIVIVPVYLSLLGKEGYGLIAFFLTLTNLLALFDFGLSPLSSRMAARFNSGAMPASTLWGVMLAIELVFLTMGTVITVLVLAGAKFIAADWINVELLDPLTVRHAVMMMAPILGLRLLGALYRSTIIGFERYGWLGIFNVAATLARTFFVVPAIMLSSGGIQAFFLAQLAIAVAETGALYWRARTLMPPRLTAVRASFAMLREHLHFSLGIAFAAVCWTLVSNVDRFVLVGLLPLAQFGLFSLAVTLATGVLMLAAPVTTMLAPTLTRLHAAGDKAGFYRRYAESAQLMTAIPFLLAVTLAVFGETLLYGWTGDTGLAAHVAPILQLYALGTGLLTITGLPLALQAAYGQVRLQVIGSAVFAAAIVPAIAFGAVHWGALGAGGAWFGVNLVMFVLWVPIVHARFLGTSHLHWLANNVLRPATLPAACIVAVALVLPKPDGRIMALSEFGLAYGCGLLVAMATTPWLRHSGSMVLARLTGRRSA